MSATVGGIATASPYQNWAKLVGMNWKKILRDRKRRNKQSLQSITHWNIVRGDSVMILHGRDKGKIGKVTRVARRAHRVTVEGANLNYRFSKPEGDKPGGVYRVESPIHVSNVNLVDPSTQASTRVAIKYDEAGNKVRVAKASGAIIPWPNEVLRERAKPRPSTAGPLDTAPEAATAVTFQGLEAEFAQLQALRAARRADLVKSRGLAHKYADAEQGLYQTRVSQVHAAAVERE